MEREARAKRRQERKTLYPRDKDLERVCPAIRSFRGLDICKTIPPPHSMGRGRKISVTLVSQVYRESSRPVRATE